MIYFSLECWYHFYASINFVLSQAWLWRLLLSRLSLSSLLLTFTCAGYEFYSCIQLPKSQVFHFCPPYLPISMISIPSKFSALSSFKKNCCMWKLVSKALTNLMAHFIFLLIRILNHCDYLMIYMPANYELRVSTSMFTWGTLSTPCFFLILSWYHVLLFLDAFRCEISWKLVSPRSLFMF